MRQMQRARKSAKASGKDTGPKRYHFDRRAADLIGLAPGKDGDDLLSTKQVAAWLGISEQWLEGARKGGYGPVFQKFGPRCIRYRRDAVLKFLEQRTYSRKSEYLAQAEA